MKEMDTFPFLKRNDDSFALSFGRKKQFRVLGPKLGEDSFWANRSILKEQRKDYMTISDLLMSKFDNYYEKLFEGFHIYQNYGSSQIHLPVSLLIPYHCPDMPLNSWFRRLKTLQ